MWIDTHCHLNAEELVLNRDSMVQNAFSSGVSGIIIPAIDRSTFASARTTAALYPNCAYALGIHPHCVRDASDDDLEYLRSELKAGMHDSRLVAIGEIGLDLFKPELKEGALLEKQQHFYIEQLKMAREFGLPVLLHSRRSVDLVLKYLRRIETPGGIAHAFNGSFQQAEIFMQLGFKISFGGAFTYERAQHLRRLAALLPENAIVVETDSPDMPPAWLGGEANTPTELPRIGAELAALRSVPASQLAAATTTNACMVIPRLKTVIKAG